MRYLYTILFYLATPFIAFRFYLKGRKNPAYHARLAERFGYIKPISTAQSLWVHAVSLGESIAATPLIKALMQEYPHYSLVVTTTTPTGFAQLTRTFGDKIRLSYTPLDLPSVVRRFIRRTRPAALVIMETELWPNLLIEVRKHAPILLANARLSPKSYHHYRRYKSLLAPALRQIDCIAAQSDADAERFKGLGVDPKRVITTGNLKFDITPHDMSLQQGKQLRQCFGHRPTFIAASTHEGEETEVLAAFTQILAHFPQALLILVPRHPERFSHVAQLCKNTGLPMLARSTSQAPTPDTKIYLADTLGELPLLFAASDIAFVGGSLVPIGGHNLIEPASLGLAILSGPHLDNFAAIADLLTDKEALLIVNDANELAARVIELLQDVQLCQRAGARALSVSEQNRGALLKHVGALRRLLMIKEGGLRATR